MNDSKETKHLKTLHCIFTDIEWKRNRSVFTNAQRKVMLKEMAALEWAIEQLQGAMKRTIPLDAETPDYMVGQRVIHVGQGGIDEIGTIVAPNKGIHDDEVLCVYSPTRNGTHRVSIHAIRPLPNGQL